MMSLVRLDLGPYAPQGSTTLLPKLSVTSKVSARTSCAWVGNRVRFQSSEDVTLLEFTSPVDREYTRRCQKYRLRTSASLPKFPTTLWCIRALSPSLPKFATTLWCIRALDKDPRRKQESNPGLSLSRRTPYHQTKTASLA